MIVAPDDGGDMHLHMLSRISSYLLQEEFTGALRHAATAAEFLRIFEEAEEQETAQTGQQRSARPKARAYWRLQTAARASSTHAWRRRACDKKPLGWGFPLKWKQTAPARSATR